MSGRVTWERSSSPGGHAWDALTESPKARFTLTALGGLLAYLAIAKMLTPEFTDYWGYLTIQTCAVLAVAMISEVIFRDEGGLSWLTHVLAVTGAFADVLGNDANLYLLIDPYDKLTHFVGVAALSAFLYDCGRLLNQRGALSKTAKERFVLAVTVAIVMGFGWEMYEAIGDHVFHTARVGGFWDTSNDMASDILGAIAAAWALFLWETRRAPRPGEEAVAEVTEPAQSVITLTETGS
jgi:hypothetical protein